MPVIILSSLSGVCAPVTFRTELELKIRQLEILIHREVRCINVTLIPAYLIHESFSARSVECQLHYISASYTNKLIGIGLRTTEDSYITKMVDRLPCRHGNIHCCLNCRCIDRLHFFAVE